MKTDPVILAAHLVMEKQRWAAVVIDEDVQTAVIIEIAHSQSARRPHLLKSRTGLRTHIFETSAVAVKKQEWLLVCDSGGVDLNHVVRVPI